MLNNLCSGKAGKNIPGERRVLLQLYTGRTDRGQRCCDRGERNGPSFLSILSVHCSSLNLISLDNTVCMKSLMPEMGPTMLSTLCGTIKRLTRISGQHGVVVLFICTLLTQSLTYPRKLIRYPQASTLALKAAKPSALILLHGFHFHVAGTMVLERVGALVHRCIVPVHVITISA